MQSAAGESKAQEFLDAVFKGDHSAASAFYDEAMAKALPKKEKLEAIRDGLRSQFGQIKKQSVARRVNGEKYDAVFVTCEFEKSTIEARVVFDKKGQVTGLFFQPPGSAFPVPAYAKKDSFRERDVTVGTGEFALSGTLTMPVGDGPFPAVVLVHGSGPQDRDETIGLLKPFRDLAWGLASRGIAVVRYEKRTKQHGAKMIAAKQRTLDDETTDDALAAAALLRTTPSIDPKRVFIIGHSQGAMLAPRMTGRDQRLAGIVLLAGPSRSLDVVMLEQTERVLKRPNLADSEKKLLTTLTDVATRFRDGKLKPDTPDADLMSIPATYWIELFTVSAVADSQKLRLPILILQGELDVQVTMDDFRGWEKAMAGRANVTLKSYPGLGHAFTPSDGKGNPAELATAANVAPVVVSDIADWIGKHGR
jgi:hypothetical protein